MKRRKMTSCEMEKQSGSGSRRLWLEVAFVRVVMRVRVVVRVVRGGVTGSAWLGLRGCAR